MLPVLAMLFATRGQIDRSVAYCRPAAKSGQESCHVDITSYDYGKSPMAVFARTERHRTMELIS